jgi:hypothetical protein
MRKQKVHPEVFRNAVDLVKGAETMTVKPLPPGYGGYTEYAKDAYGKKRVRELGLPGSADAVGRTIRLHEMIHAQRQLPPLSNQQTRGWQAVMDARVHVVDWPADLPKQATRDALATALLDVRHLDVSTPRNWSLSVHFAFRALAIAQTADRRGVHFSKDTAVSMIRKQLCKVFPKKFVAQLEAMLGYAVHPDYECQKIAAKHLDKYMVPVPPDTVPGMRKQGDEEGWLVDEPLSGLPPWMQPPLIDGEGKEKPDAPFGCGTAKTNFSIKELPRTQECLPAPRMERARSGLRMNRHKLTRAFVTSDPTGLFQRLRTLRPQGSIVFDASGSMGVSAERLNLLCRAAPGANVAYYYGDDGLSGELVIYAKDGMRYGGEKLPPHPGGNSVDLEAILWLLAQEGPRILVTDRGFCGGSDGSAARAQGLLAMQEAMGNLRVIPSIQHALKEFKVKDGEDADDDDDDE